MLWHKLCKFLELHWRDDHHSSQRFSITWSFNEEPKVFLLILSLISISISQMILAYSKLALTVSLSVRISPNTNQLNLTYNLSEQCALLYGWILCSLCVLQMWDATHPAHSMWSPFRGPPAWSIVWQRCTDNTAYSTAKQCIKYMQEMPQAYAWTGIYIYIWMYVCTVLCKNLQNIYRNAVQ